MQCLPRRLNPGADLRADLEALSAFVVSGIGNLACARLRLAGADVETGVA